MEIRPLSARSVVLSILLAVHPPEMSARELVALGEEFDIPESTLRAALTRLVAAGDLERTDRRYRIGPRMAERQRRQDQLIAPEFRDWDGTWEVAVIVAAGRSASDRAGLRQDLAQLRLAELREGVWMRPANLDRHLPDWPSELICVVHGLPADVAQTVRRLWDLPSWIAQAQTLLGLVGSDISAAQRLAAAAALVRHLRTDPALPSALLPAGWNAEELRAVYRDYQAELTAVLTRVPQQA